MLSLLLFSLLLSSFSNAYASPPSNATAFQDEELLDLMKRATTKYVFMHHIVGLTNTFTVADWEDDWRRIRAKGIDAVALNIGDAAWQRTQVANAYQAAQNVNNGLKLFYSFDLTEIGCNLDDLVNRVNQFANHPAQFKFNNKPLVSSFSGDCLGNGGWQSLKDRTGSYLMPFVWGLEGNFQNWPSLDSWQCWGCAWPQGNYAKNLDDDNYYISQLGNKYAAVVSPGLYTHYTWKNRYLRGDDWLFVNRWEQLMSLQNTVTFVEIATWNDFGESSYVGPIKGTPPDGTTWINGFPHTAWHDMSQYFITAFKNGAYPTVTQDAIYFWARTHPENANPSGDSVGRPDGWDWGEDSLWAVAFATSPAVVTLKCGSSSAQFNVNAGYTKLKLPLSPGQITVQMTRNGQSRINYTPSDYRYITNPVIYNLNVWVGSAVA